MAKGRIKSSYWIKSDILMSSPTPYTNSPKGEGTMLPVDFVAPYLYKYDAAIKYSMLAFAPKSLSVALINAISSPTPDFLLTPA